MSPLTGLSTPAIAKARPEWFHACDEPEEATIGNPLRSQAMKTKTMPHWLPAAFCAAISAISLITSIATTNRGGWGIFLCYMPLCFMFVGRLVLQMRGEIQELRQRIAEMEGKGGS